MSDLEAEHNFPANWRQLARIPEHSISLMSAMSGAEAFAINNYLFYKKDDWLTAIAQPLYGLYDDSFSKTLKQAIRQCQPRQCFCMGAKLPNELEGHIRQQDRFYVLSAKAPVPAKLAGSIARAAQALSVKESAIFSSGHRKLWAEFLGRNASKMPARVAALYAQTPKALAQSQGELRLLDAVNANGQIVASLLLDFAPDNFVSYILGAHSKAAYHPHATDLLFAAMLEKARQENKAFIHLGLGVNDGITRFKRKWGALPSWPYLYAEWEEKASGKLWQGASIARDLTFAVLKSEPLSKRQLLANEPESRPFAMLWQVEKNRRISWLGGTAHFFAHSFEPSFRKLFKNVDNVIFEGPLDAAFLAKVDEAGKVVDKNTPAILKQLNQDDLRKLEKTILSGNSILRQAHSAPDIPWLLSHSRPWRSFFTLWTTFLENQGWLASVDMEAWRIAHEMGKNVVGMENLEEQLASLDSLPPERVVRFFKNCASWKKLARHNRCAYLAGDLEKMIGSSAEFPTRTEHVVGKRDQRFRERMRPWLERGNSAIFVGSAHLVNLRHMLVADGFRVQQKPFGLWPRLHLRWRNFWRPDEKIKW